MTLGEYIKGSAERILHEKENPRYAKSIIEDACRIHKKDSSHRKIKNLQNKISGYNSNLDALVERLVYCYINF